MAAHRRDTARAPELHALARLMRIPAYAMFAVAVLALLIALVTAIGVALLRRAE